MAGGSFLDAGCSDCSRDGGLQDGLVQVVATNLLGRRVAVAPRRGENPLPEPIACRVGEFPRECAREFDPASAAGEVAGVRFLDPSEVCLEFQNEECGR